MLLLSRQQLTSYPLLAANTDAVPARPSSCFHISEEAVLFCSLSNYVRGMHDTRHAICCLETITCDCSEILIHSKIDRPPPPSTPHNFTNIICVWQEMVGGGGGNKSALRRWEYRKEKKLYRRHPEILGFALIYKRHHWATSHPNFWHLLKENAATVFEYVAHRNQVTYCIL